MPCIDREWTKNSSGCELDNIEQCIEADDATIKANMIVGAKAKHVARRIWAVVRAAHGPHMCTFGIRPCRRLNPLSARLTPEVVELLDPLGHRRIPNETLDCRISPSTPPARWLPRRRVSNRILDGRPDQSKTLDIARGSLGFPIALGVIDAVVAVPGGWGKAHADS